MATAAYGEVKGECDRLRAELGQMRALLEAEARRMQCNESDEIAAAKASFQRALASEQRSFHTFELQAQANWQTSQAQLQQQLLELK